MLVDSVEMRNFLDTLTNLNIIERWYYSVYYGPSSDGKPTVQIANRIGIKSKHV